MNFKSIIPNALTTGNLLGGIFAIFFIFIGKIDFAPWCFLLSAIFDFLDGFVARILNANSKLGKQLDSLSDMVTFGVAPGFLIFGLILYSIFVNYNKFEFIDVSELNFSEIYSLVFFEWIKILSDFHYKDYVFLLPFTGFIFPIFALFRLAKFNIDKRQVNSFIGLPTPGAALFFASFPLILSGFESTIFGLKIPLNLIVNPYFLVLSTITISILMISEVRLFSFKFKTFRWHNNEIRFVFLAIAIVLICTFWFWAIPLIIFMYIIISLFINIFIT